MEGRALGKKDFDNLTAEDLIKALNSAENAYGNALTRAVRIKNRKPTAITDKNCQVKLLELLQGDGKTGLKSYKYLTLSFLFNLKIDDNDAAKKIVKSTQEWLVKKYGAIFENNKQKTEELKKLLESNCSNWKRILELIRDGANPDVKTTNGHAAIHAAAVSKPYDPEVVKELIVEHHANINAVCEHCKETPLQAVLKTSDDAEAVPVKTPFHLLKFGALVNDKSAAGFTFLHYLAASPEDCSSEIRFLVKTYHPDLRATNGFMGVTPLQLVNLLEEDAKKSDQSKPNATKRPHPQNRIALLNALAEHPESHSGFSINGVLEWLSPKSEPKPPKFDFKEIDQHIHRP